MAGVEGNAPSSGVLETLILLLNYTPIWHGTKDSNPDLRLWRPPFTVLKTAVLPLHYSRIIFYLLYFKWRCHGELNPDLRRDRASS